MPKRPQAFVLFVLSIASLIVTSFSSCDRLSEEVNISDIPDYYFENNYLDNRVKAINDAIAECSDGSETFFWITDIHWEPDLNTRKSPMLIKYIATKTGVNKILNGVLRIMLFLAFSVHHCLQARMPPAILVLW